MSIGPATPDGSFMVPQWLAAMFTPLTAGLGALLLALINRTPKFQEVVNDATKTLLEAQEQRIRELGALVQQLTYRITLLENALIENGVAVPAQSFPDSRRNRERVS